ncbi:PA14 domain-containing protein, partial [Neobacillus drentensis]|uniref:PA14 domain-containing protein n=1 Tax=Neobacillus drentensis TaxID=220684 RepID=UPI002FFEFC23
DVHWIEVEYREDVLNGYVDVSLTPFPVLTLKTGKGAHYNWGYGSPASGYPSDYFVADIDQSGTYAKGDYFLQTFADDGVKVEVDGETKINRWTDYTGGMEKALWLGVAEGQHTVKTRYLENVAAAGVFSDVVPFGSWLAYYYPNDSLSGMPAAAKVISTDKLSEKFPGSPAEGIGADHFSARYTTAKRIAAGDYVLRMNADDGLRVFVDGKLVADRWNKNGESTIKLKISDRTDAKAGEQDIHWVEVEYHENVLNGNVDVSLSPLKEEMNDTWVGEFYPNRTFEGNPYIIGGNSASNKLSSINFNWNLASPFPEIPADNFSARFSKKVLLETGSYLFTVNADDKVRVLLDNQVIMDYWSSNNYSKNRNVVYVSGGEHTLVVEYQEDILQARLSFDYEKISSNKVFYQAAEQVENNWAYGGPSGFPVDGFEAYFDQSRTLPSGDYFMETLADDRAVTKVDGEVKIDNGDNAPGQVNQALLLNMKSGYHDITTNYYEKVDKAYIYSHILPLGNWVAYYYPYNTFSGQPIAAKTISPSGAYNSLSENNALGSPVPGQVPVDNFSAIYRTAKRLPAGEYVIRSKADDKIRVYIDGQLAYDGWTPVDFSQESIKVSITDRNVTNSAEKDIHWIEVQYSEQTGQSYLDFTILPLKEVFASDQWVGMFYSNKTLSGNPYIVGGIGAEQPINTLNFDWGFGSPHNRLPADGFSAKFIKKAFYNSGLYQINVSADDGVRVYVDGQKIIDSWKDGINTSYSNFWLEQGNHEIVVEYYDLSSSAKLNVDMTEIAPEGGMFVSSVKLPVYRSYEELADYTIHLTFYNPSYTRYFELGYGEIVNILEVKNYAAKIRTQDGRVGWVHKDYLESNLTDDFWLVKEGRTLRSQADVKSSNIGFIPSFSKVYLLDHVTTSGPDYTEWYYVQTESGQRGWIWGALSTSGNSGYNIIKYNFSQGGTVTNEVNIFTPLNTKANVTADQINAFINFKTGGKKTLMTGMGYAYLIAQEQSGLNAIYLLAHSGLETGWGTSVISNTKYNFYGIGAIDSKPDEGAYNYSTPEGGIIAGASWISKNYPIRPGDTDDKIPYYQPTIDNMRNDNSWHQYASDEAWAAKIGFFAQEFYNFINR